MKNKYFIMLHMVVCIFLFTGCTKEFLNKKPNSTLVLPQTVDDFNLLLDNFDYVNKTPSLCLISSDEYYIPTYELYQSCDVVSRNGYIWQKDMLKGATEVPDWNKSYVAVFYANNTIQGVQENATKQDAAKWNNLLGRALFIRGKAFYDIASEFAAPYDSTTAKTDLGIPLKLNPGVDETVQRSTVQETYDQIISDLNSAKQLLTDVLPTEETYKPSKVAADALLSRIYLSMRKYSKAELYADSALAIKNELVDFNTLDTNSTRPLGLSSPETLYFTEENYTYYQLTGATPSAAYSIDTNLIQSYSKNDIRLNIFFQLNTSGGYSRKLGYAYSYPSFTGLALDEIYLIKAECAARRNDNITALKYINTLLENRYKSGAFSPYTEVEGLDVLQLVLKERRKELVYRGLRWSDLRRLNLEGKNITLKRVLNGQLYTLKPNDPRYTLPIPDDEILQSGIKQNDR